MSFLHKLDGDNWSSKFVVNQARHPDELDIMEQYEVSVIRLQDILYELENNNKKPNTFTASGKDLIYLIELADVEQAH